jgi:hypothetical protein
MKFNNIAAISETGTMTALSPKIEVLQPEDDQQGRNI